MTRLSLYDNKIGEIYPDAFDGLTKWVEKFCINLSSLFLSTSPALWHSSRPLHFFNYLKAPKHLNFRGCTNKKVVGAFCHECAEIIIYSWILIWSFDRSSCYIKSLCVMFGQPLSHIVDTSLVLSLAPTSGDRWYSGNKCLYRAGRAIWKKR